MGSSQNDLIVARPGTEMFLSNLGVSDARQAVMHLDALRRWSEAYTGRPWCDLSWQRFKCLPGTSVMRPVLPPDILDFIEWWSDQGERSADAYNRLRRSIQKYFAYEVDRKAVVRSPALDLETLRYESEPKITLRRNQVAPLLLAAADCPLNYSVVVCMLGLGLRPQEVTFMTEEDLREDLAVVKLYAKKRDNEQVLSDAAMYVLKEDWLNTQWRLQALKDVQHPSRRLVFIRGPGDPRPILPRMLTLMIKTLAIRAGLSPEVTPYTLRRTFAKLLYQSGTHVLSMSQLMRHRNLATLAKYLRHGTSDETVEHTEILDWIERAYRPGFQLGN